MVETLIVTSWSLLILSTIALVLKPNYLTGFAFLCFMVCALGVSTGLLNGLVCNMCVDCLNYINRYFK